MHRSDRVWIWISAPRPSFRVALAELGGILWAWRCGGGELVGLLVAWWQVISGRVRTRSAGWVLLPD
jgi:hypothetical protein